MRHFVSTKNKPDKEYFGISEFFSKSVMGIMQEISDTKDTLVAQNCLNTSGN